MRRLLRGLGLIGGVVIFTACDLLAGGTDQPAAPSPAASATSAPVNTATATAEPSAIVDASATVDGSATAAVTPTLVPPTPTIEPPPVILPTPAAGAQVLAYLLVDQDLWVYRRDSDVPQQMTRTGDVQAISAAPDGAWVAFVRSPDQVSYSLWAAGADGSERELMTAADFAALPRPPEASALSVGEMQWAPGGQVLAFSTRPIFEGLGPDSSHDLWLINVETGERRQLLPPGEGGGAFTFSPDGRQVALSDASAISLIDIDGGNRRDGVLTFPPVLTYSEWTYYPAVRWAADSSALRVVIPPEAPLERPDEPAVVWSVPADGSPATQLFTFVPSPLSYPQLSPDGSWVAYLRPDGPPESTRSELHIARADGAEDVIYLTEEQVQFTGWAPDSQQFVFSLVNPPRSYIGRVGETPRPVSDTPNVFNVRWIDENNFLFITRTVQAVELRQGQAGEPSQLIFRSSDPMDMLDFSLPSDVEFP